MERGKCVRQLDELADLLDIQTAAEQYTGKPYQDKVTGDYLDPNTQALAQVLIKRREELAESRGGP